MQDIRRSAARMSVSLFFIRKNSFFIFYNTIDIITQIVYNINDNNGNIGDRKGDSAWNGNMRNGVIK